VNGGSGRRGQNWNDDIRGGLSAFLLEAVIVVVLVAFAVVVAFLALSVV
jgi:hypothetical protein